VGNQVIQSARGGFSFVVARTKPQHREQSLQEKVVRALKLALTRETTFFAVPNGGSRSRIEAAILDGQGVLPGVPDLILISNGRAFGLELKGENGSLSGAQRAAQVALRDAGMRVEVARSLDEALEHLRDMGIPLRFRASEYFGKGRA
jgi:hypothetical protein